MILAVTEKSEASIDEVKFHKKYFKVLKRLDNLVKTHFLFFAPLVGDFSNKHHYSLLKILKILCFSCFCPK